MRSPNPDINSKNSEDSEDFKDPNFNKFLNINKLKLKELSKKSLHLAYEFYKKNIGRLNKKINKPGYKELSPILQEKRKRLISNYSIIPQSPELKQRLQEIFNIKVTEILNDIIKNNIKMLVLTEKTSILFKKAFRDMLNANGLNHIKIVSLDPGHLQTQRQLNSLQEIQNSYRGGNVMIFDELIQYGRATGGVSNALREQGISPHNIKISSFVEYEKDSMEDIDIIKHTIYAESQNYFKAFSKIDRDAYLKGDRQDINLEIFLENLSETSPSGYAMKNYAGTIADLSQMFKMAVNSNP